MTIHAAKGLEFPIVILANLGSQEGRRRCYVADHKAGRLYFSFGRDRVFTQKEYEKAWEEEEAELKMERQRLLYVAMTRARDHLILPVFKLKKKEAEYLDWLIEFITGAESLSEGGRELVRILDETLEGNFVEPVKSDEEADIGGLFHRLLDLSEERERLVAATAQRKQDIIRPSDEWEAGVLTVDEGGIEAAEALAAGRALHEYLARAPIGVTPDYSMLKIICEREDASYETVVKMTENTVRSHVWRKAQESGRSWREVPISYIDGNVIVRGRIDLVWEDGDGIQLADFKSGVVQPDSHRRQLERYARGIELATGRKVSAGWIVTARDGGVHRLW